VQSTKLSVFLRIFLVEPATAELHAFKELLRAFALIVGAARGAGACEVMSVAFDGNLRVAEPRGWDLWGKPAVLRGTPLF
jgi:hypothetical protein